MFVFVNLFYMKTSQKKKDQSGKVRKWGLVRTKTWKLSIQIAAMLPLCREAKKRRSPKVTDVSSVSWRVLVMFRNASFSSSRLSSTVFPCDA